MNGPENPRVGGSIPSQATNLRAPAAATLRETLRVALSLLYARDMRALLATFAVVVATAGQASAATTVPLPFIVCAQVEGGQVLGDSSHATYEGAKARMEAVLQDGLEVVTGPPTITHRIPADRIVEVMVWDWREAGDAPACPAPLPRPGADGQRRPPAGLMR